MGFFIIVVVALRHVVAIFLRGERFQPTTHVDPKRRFFFWRVGKMSVWWVLGTGKWSKMKNACVSTHYPIHFCEPPIFFSEYTPVHTSHQLAFPSYQFRKK
jgi:hypothetical protein